MTAYQSTLQQRLAHRSNTMHASTEPQTTEPKTVFVTVDIGDVVELKSGGPHMTIAELDTGANYALDADVRSVTCLWFDQGEVRMGKFIPQTLRLVR